MKKVLFIAFFAITFTSLGQEYKTAIGLRGSYTGWGALNIKHMLSDNHGLEGTIGGGRNYLWAEALYEWNSSIPKVDGLGWYLGAGGALGTYSNGYTHQKENYNGFHLGARGVIGIEYTIPSLPLNFAFHTGPYIGLINSYGFGWHGSFAIRYAIK